MNEDKQKPEAQDKDEQTQQPADDIDATQDDAPDDVVEVDETPTKQPEDAPAEQVVVDETPTEEQEPKEMPVAPDTDDKTDKKPSPRVDKSGETPPVDQAVAPRPQYEKWPGEWYVLHTYSGYEDAVAESLKQRIDSLDMQDKIFGVLVPKENQIEIRSGKRRTVEKKIFPGYVLVNMNVSEDSWYVVRNTPSVTGFIGSGTIPVPVSKAEIQTILKRMSIEEPKYKIDLKSGDLVHINDGPFKSYNGTVSEVDEERGKIKVLVSIFGRETPVELDFLQVKKV